MNRRLIHIIYIILLIVFLLPKEVFPQKYIKYYVKDNTVSFVAEKSLRKITDQEILKENHPDDIPFMVLAKTLSSIKLIVSEIKQDAGLLEDIDLLELKYSNKNEFKLLKSDIKEFNQTSIAFIEMTYTENDEEVYHLIYESFYKDGILIRFSFSCPKKKMDKWKPIAWDMIKSLKIR